MVVEAGDALKHGARIIHFGGRAVLPERLVVCKPQVCVCVKQGGEGDDSWGGGRSYLELPGLKQALQLDQERDGGLRLLQQHHKYQRQHPITRKPTTTVDIANVCAQRADVQ